ncbi:hypothetical protein [Polaromonas sp. JS666]|uniref:hypothetical protein n=1 Tax=Polaromonas sp. (strain JS666 / ATCC BAA-500) TaxID=296591 RepID=UPI0000537CD7|nr:hypothetical protein [Polaromonas sp. JS666]ABE47246.1 hypothetical protein Bpro_5392 [Polaromonas sp. JS666]
MMATQWRAAVLLAVAIGALAWSLSSHAGPCKDEFRYILSVRPGDDSTYLSIDSEGSLPIRHIGGEKTLVLSVERLSENQVLVEAMFATDRNLASWRATIQMDSQHPKAFGREFRPKPDMPVFGIALIPLCKGT